MADPPRQFSDATAVADALIERLNGRVILGLPLGLGKANLIANALYQRAANDRAIELKILTALTLEPPRGKTGLEQRFIDPIRARIFDGYPELEYARALRGGFLPDNIEVSEFFLSAGRWLGTPASQRNFIMSNYTHAARTLIDRGVNVVAQMVARDGDRLSLSCNTDLTPDLLAARSAGQTDFLMVGEVNQTLPFMHGDASVPLSSFEYLLEGPQCSYTLFAPPKPPVALADYSAGFRIAQLIPDGGSLQIGIGSIGDAVAKALIMRQQNNAEFREITRRLSVTAEAGEGLIQETPFVDGLFGVSEMLVDSFLPMIEAGVVKREVDGAVMHAAFFLGPRVFYDQLRDMPEHERRRIQMKPVSWVNSLYRDEDKKRGQRVKARFVNNAMMATLLGAVVSDGLEDGRVVSGVGGQYDFVAQAFALEGARSIIALNATRVSKHGVQSNILWSYGNQTVPRHLRDIIVTEYGVADLRGKTDAEVIAAMLAITDSRFQNDLLAQARSAGKIDDHYEIPEACTNNTPEYIATLFEPAKSDGSIPVFPFGSDFTAIEQRLLPVLESIAVASSNRRRLMMLILRGVTVKPVPYLECLERLGLGKPKKLSEWIFRFLVLGALVRD